MITAVPALAPVTVPFTTVAFVLLLVHVPPLVASVSVTLSPTHKLAVKGLIDTGALLTVTGFVTKQPEELVNVMLAVPMPEPVTVPVPLPTLAMLLLLLLHVPLPSDNVVLDPRQIVTGVTGMIAEGEAFTVTLAVVIQLPIAYVITAVPALAPVTVPLTTVALVLPLVHVPPDTPSVSTVVRPWQSIADDGLIADGALFTVTGFIEGQLLLFVKVILTVPELLPITIPLKLPTLAILPLLLLQVPEAGLEPENAESVVVVPAHNTTDVVGRIKAVSNTVTAAAATHVPIL